jgi:hypothetical protein
MHDLVRLYTERLGRTEAGSDDRSIAWDRLLDHYDELATSAMTHACRHG